METKDIIANNEMIALFMGAYIEPNSNNRYNLLSYHNLPPAKNSNLLHTAIVCGAEDMQYHKSWNWLIPVVEKIESLEVTDDFRIEIAQVRIIASTGDSDLYHCTEYSNNGRFKDTEGGINTKIEAVHNAVVEFIKWYNQNKQS